MEDPRHCKPRSWRSFLSLSMREERKGYGFAHCFVTRGRWMQVIAAVENGEQMIGMLRIAHYSIEIYDCVEVTGGANPLIHGLSVGLTQRPGMIISRSHIRSNCRPVNTQAVRTGARYQLLIRGEYSLYQGGMFRGRYFAVPGESAEIVHALEDDDPLRTRWSQDIAIEARQRIRPQAIGQQMIAADALVRHSNVAGMRRALQTLPQYVRPAVVSVGCGAVAVGDGIPEGHYGFALRIHIDF